MGIGGDRRRIRGFDDAVRPLVIVWSIGVVVLGAVRAQRAASPEQLFLDVAYYLGIDWYTGMMSALGVLAWTVAAAGCVATAFVTSLADRPGASRAFRVGAIVLAVQLFEDLFLLHSGVLPRLTGAPEPVWHVALLALTGWWVTTSWQELARTRWGLLLAGGAGLGASLVIDLAIAEGGEWYLLAEDGPKFLGILALATWSTMSAADVIRSVVEAGQRPAEASPHPAGVGAEGR